MGNSLSLVNESLLDYIDTQGPGIRYREKARAEAKLREDVLKRSQEAYNQNRGAEAKQLSDEGKEHTRKMEQYNRWAADAIYAHYNPNPKNLATIDLHGLYVNEAIERAERHIVDCKKAGVERTVFITGKGSRSRDGIAKLKPAIEGVLRRHNVVMIVDHPNPGCITIEGLQTEGPSRCLMM